MTLGYRHRHFAAAFLAVVLVAGGANAQGGGAKGSSIEGRNAAIDLINSCAAIWAIKDRQELVKASQNAKATLERAFAGYTTSITNLQQAYLQAKAEFERLTDQMAETSFGQAIVGENAEKKGLLSAAQVKLQAVNVLKQYDSGLRDQAEAKMNRLKTEINGAKRRMVAWYAAGVAVTECVTSQEEYLKKTANDPKQQAAAPPSPAPPPGRTLTGFISGGWSGGCSYDKTSIAVNGRFTLQITESAFGGTFVDGEQTSINGSVDKNGQLKGSGSLTQSGTVYAMTMTGRVRHRADGSLGGEGTFTANDREGTKCKGAWSN